MAQCDGAISSKQSLARRRLGRSRHAHSSREGCRRSASCVPPLLQVGRHGLPLFSSECVSSAGSRVTTSRSNIPVVFALWADPVGSGYIASLARPGGNATGLSIQSLDTAAKRLELIREVVPNLQRLAILARLDNPSNVVKASEVEAAARKLGVEVTMWNIRRNEDIAPTFEQLKSRADAIHVVSDPLLLANGIRINTLAVGARLPTVYSFREGVELGALMSYGANFPKLWQRAAELVDKILRGAKSGDIPVEQPTKFDLVVNLITARALGLEVPPMLLARADEVIE